MRDFSFESLCVTIVVLTFIISLITAVTISSNNSLELKSKCLEKFTPLECNIIKD